MFINKLLLRASVLVFTIFFSVGCSEKNYIAKVKVRNDSNFTISDVRIKIYAESFLIESLAPKDEHEFSYKVKGDASYDVEWTSQAGSHTEKNIGYVTAGMNMQDQIVIKDSNVEYSIIKFY